MVQQGRIQDFCLWGFKNCLRAAQKTGVQSKESLRAKGTILLGVPHKSFLNFTFSFLFAVFWGICNPDSNMVTHYIHKSGITIIKYVIISRIF